MSASRILEPGSKLATARALAAETRHSTLGELLGLEDVDEDELYEAMDWLLRRQAEIESALAQRHLFEGTVVLYGPLRCDLDVFGATVLSLVQLLEQQPCTAPPCFVEPGLLPRRGSSLWGVNPRWANPCWSPISPWLWRLAPIAPAFPSPLRTAS